MTILKKVLHLLLILSLIVTSPPTAWAAAADKKESKKVTVFTAGTTKKLNLNAYLKKVDKNASYTVKSSNGSIVAFTGKATAENKFRVTLKAKKAGKAKITIIQSLKGKKKNAAVYTFTIKKKKSDARINELLEMPLADIMEQIYDGVSIELPKRWNQEITKENSSYYLGIENMEFEEGIASEAMITSVPYSVCLIKLKKGTDVADITKKMKKNVNPNKWICVGVDPKNVLVGNIDRLVLLVMTDNGAQEIMDSFLALSKEPKKAAAASSQNKLINKGSYYSKPLAPYNEKSVRQLSAKIDTICRKYLKDSKDIFYSIIPDKSYFIKNSFFPKEDYAKLIKTMKKNVKKADYISIIDTLQLSDYYKTDLHWKQNKLFDTVSALGKKMDFKLASSSFAKQTLRPYQGVYASYIKNAPAETFVYLTSFATKNAEAELYDVKGKSPVYDLTKWKNDVPYDIFLSGSNPLITITNPKADKTRELLIFGDSFANSLAPLLLEAYSRITLIDLRFVSSGYLDKFVDFNKQEVLFLYNTAVINNSSMLK